MSSLPEALPESGKIHAANACKVLVVDINEKGLRKVATVIKATTGVCKAVCADVTDEDQVIRSFYDTVSQCVKLDVLVLGRALEHAFFDETT